jgi:D-serine deaminase-like pyridoxal phosphate-dependent protein
MADEGFGDIMVLHPFFGPHKEDMLRRLASRPDLTLSCVVDMVEHAEIISRVGQGIGKRIPVLLKIDTGVKRFGVLPGTPALQLAKEIYGMPGIEFAGIVTHESTHGERTAEGVDRVSREVPALMAATTRLLRNNGIPVRDVSIGSTPSLRNAAILKDHPEITELHPGMYIFGDLMYVSNFAMPLERCALSVLVTVIGVQDTPPPRAMIDGGGKTFTPDVLFHLRNDPGYLQEGRPRYGLVKDRPDLWFGRLPAENGVLYFSGPGKRARLGERLEIIPNNASMVVAIHDEIYGVRGGEVERVFRITGRGAGN